MMNRKIISIAGLVFIFGVAVQFGMAQAGSQTAVVAGQAVFEAPGLRYVVWPEDEGKPPMELKITQNTSQVLRFDRPVIRVAISDPEVCDIETLGGQELLIYAKKQGKISLIVWDENYSIAAFTLESTVDIAKLEEILRGIDQWGSYRILPFKESVMVYAQTDTQEKVKKIEDAITAFDEKAVHFIQVRKPKLVLLEVRFAEIQRKDDLDFGLDVEFISRKWFGSGFMGRTSPTEENDDAFTPYLGKFGAFPLKRPTSAGSTDFALTYLDKNRMITPYLQWLEQNNVLRIIARPNLLAKDGEKAKFVVGGEFPIATTSFQGVNVEYKEFGNIVEFTPEVLDNELLRLKVKAEVSELDFTNTVVLAGSTIPSILKRNQETVAVLRPEETLVIGGMITQRISQVTRKTPILGDIPLLGRLFRKVDNSRTDVELLIIITPHIVSPFEMGENKKYFDKEKIERLKESIQIYHPEFPNPSGDAINQLLVQGEKKQGTDIPKKIAEQIVAEIKAAEQDKLKPAETRAGQPLQKADPPKKA